MASQVSVHHQYGNSCKNTGQPWLEASNHERFSGWVSKWLNGLLRLSATLGPEIQHETWVFWRQKMVGHTGISQSYLLARCKAAYGSKSEITDYLKKFYIICKYSQSWCRFFSVYVEWVNQPILLGPCPVSKATCLTWFQVQWSCDIRHPQPSLCQVKHHHLHMGKDQK